ncbi:MAG: DMT family transporter, partial [Chlamydiales bacterium]|nr:DMT family transporter [Chlamydiales bacterium]
IKNVFGFFAVVLMAFFFAFGFLYSEKHIRDIPPIESTTIQMLFTSLTLIPVHLLFGESIDFSFANYPALLSAFLLGVGCTAFGWLFYFLLLKRGVSATNISISTLICPVFAIALSSFILHEDITPYKIIGTTVILSSVFFMSELSTDLFVKVRKTSISDRE